MNSQARKKAISDFKSQKPAAGVYAIRCTPTGSAWVGAFPNLTAAKNGLYFALRTGAHREKSLQQEWNAHGEADFTFEILEQLDEETPQMLVRDTLKARREHWMRELGARVLL